MHPIIDRPARRAWRCAAASIVALAFGSGAARAAEPPLKVCADPDNLPFSSSADGPRGFYLDLADRLAKALGRSPEQVWQLTYLGKRAVRSSLLAHRCDLFIGLPGAGDFMKQQLIMTKPFAVFRYALVLPLGSSVQALADLRGRRVAVQLASPPQTLLAGVEGVRSVTVLSPEEGMRALADGRADAAYLWGPSAGYQNKTAYAGRYRVIPTEGDGMAWPVAIGFPRSESVLRDSVQRELDALGPWLAGAEASYGFPAAAPVRLAETAAAPIRLAAAGDVSGLYAQADAPAAKAPAGNEAQALRGHELFNANCAHCHGTDAASPEKRIDLRRLQKKYSDTVDEVFATTVQNGRPDKGMPPWKGVLPEADISAIKAYVDSVQQSK